MEVRPSTVGDLKEGSGAGQGSSAEGPVSGESRPDLLTVPADAFAESSVSVSGSSAVRVDAENSGDNSGENSKEEAGGFLAVLPVFLPSHKRVLRIGLSLMLAILALEWCFLVTRRPEPIELERGSVFVSTFRVHVNEAGWIEWMQLEGIGPSLAHRIVADRRAHGPFATIDDVGRVPGIGPATLDRIRPWLTIHHDPSESRSTETDSASSDRARSHAARSSAAGPAPGVTAKK